MIHASIVRDSRLSAAMMLAFGLAACASGPEEAPAPLDEAPPVAAGPVQSGWTANDGMDAPESVYFDEASGSIFVSQIVGTPDGRDGMGHITRLDSAGTSSMRRGSTASTHPRACGVMTGYCGLRTSTRWSESTSKPATSLSGSPSTARCF